MSMFLARSHANNLAKKENQTGDPGSIYTKNCKQTDQVARGGGAGLGYDTGLASLHFNTVGTLRHFPGQKSL